MSFTVKKIRAEALFCRAAECEERGEFRQAFKFMLAAAKLGDSGAQVNVGNFYDEGKGVRRSRQKAFYWYRRAYKQGDHCAADNIAVMWRNEKKFERALSWFERAVKLGDDEAHLEIAKYYLDHTTDIGEAIKHLEIVVKAYYVTEDGREEARRLLKDVKKQSNPRRA